MSQPRVILISYDLNTPGQDYTGFRQSLALYESMQLAQQVGQSSYVIIADEAVDAIRKRLLAHVDSNDELFVFEITGAVCSVHTSDTKRDWLKKYLRVLNG